ncbi:RNase H domain-containing protein [Trichonephila clavipes]|uniref:RNase H domain-containing protein n=1 Tax=Trichonephila clavipes TaxID=2585209 RepID=A0A8X6VGB0_TRICX|nr:RNase H domain-containing protein [Trichonephila clavipes]
MLHLTWQGCHKTVSALLLLFLGLPDPHICLKSRISGIIQDLTRLNELEARLQQIWNEMSQDIICVIRRSCMRGMGARLLNFEPCQEKRTKPSCNSSYQNITLRQRSDAALNPLGELDSLSKRAKIRFQWIPSHANITGNEIPDSLAKAGAGETTTPTAPLTYLELFSKYKAKNKTIWMHPWYQSKYPDGSLVRGSSRGHPTALTRFLFGHLMLLTFDDGIKHFEICPKCSSAQASPGHILSCSGLTRQGLVKDPLLALDFFRVNGLMDLI